MVLQRQILNKNNVFKNENGAIEKRLKEFIQTHTSAFLTRFG